MTLLDTLVAPPAGSPNRASVLATREFRTEKAPKPVVGDIVHVYGPQGVSYYRARVFEVSGRGIRVVGKKNDELLTPEAWNARVRPEFMDYLFVPTFLGPDEPPALPPEVTQKRATARKLASVAMLVVPVAAGAAFGSLVPEVGAARGAATALGFLGGGVAGIATGSVSRIVPGAVVGATATGALLGAGRRAAMKGAAVGAASAAVTVGVEYALRKATT